MAEKLKVGKYVKYGAGLEDLRDKARKTILDLCIDLTKQFEENQTKKTLFSNCEDTYLSFKVLAYLENELKRFPDSDLEYDWVFFLTRKSNTKKLVDNIVKEIKDTEFLITEFKGLNYLIGRELEHETLKYFRRNYRAYKIYATDDRENLYTKRRDKTVSIDDMLRALERDKIDVVLYGEGYCIMHSIKTKGAKN